MATWTNTTKHSSTFTNRDLTGVGHWADAQVTWADPLFSWNSLRTVYTNQAKSGASNVATAGLYYGFGPFTYSGGQTITGGTSIWTNLTKH